MVDFIYLGERHMSPKGLNFTSHSLHPRNDMENETNTDNLHRKIDILNTLSDSVAELRLSGLSCMYASIFQITSH
jgi:hypothetical protein